MFSKRTVLKSFVIVPKVGGAASFVGSFLVTRDVAIKLSKKEPVPLTSAIWLLVSVVELVSSFFSSFMSTWLAPKGQAPFAIGNSTSCATQGFIFTFNQIAAAVSYLIIATLCEFDTLSALCLQLKNLASVELYLADNSSHQHQFVVLTSFH